MVLETIVSITTAFLEIVLSLLPDLPDFPESFTASIDNVINIIFSNINLLGLFVRISTIKKLVPLIIVVVNFEHIYHFAMWVVKKLPISTE